MGTEKNVATTLLQVNYKVNYTHCIVTTTAEIATVSNDFYPITWNLPWTVIIVSLTIKIIVEKHTQIVIFWNFRFCRHNNSHNYDNMQNSKKYNSDIWNNNMIVGVTNGGVFCLAYFFELRNIIVM